MPVNEKDIYASAKVFIEQHGEEAIPKAMDMMKLFETSGDIEGRECWNQIAAAIKWLSEEGSKNEIIN